MLLIVTGCRGGDAVPSGESAEHVGNLVLHELGIDAAHLEGTALEVVECTNASGVGNGKESAVYSTGWTVADRIVIDEMIGRLHSSFGARFLSDPTNEVEGTLFARFFRSKSGKKLNDDVNDFVQVVVSVDPSGAFTMAVEVPC